jgi:hypothetical protein
MTFLLVIGMALGFVASGLLFQSLRITEKRFDQLREDATRYLSEIHVASYRLRSIEKVAAKALLDADPYRASTPHDDLLRQIRGLAAERVGEPQLNADQLLARCSLCEHWVAWRENECGLGNPVWPDPNCPYFDNKHECLDPNCPRGQYVGLLPPVSGREE